MYSLSLISSWAHGGEVMIQAQANLKSGWEFSIQTCIFWRLGGLNLPMLWPYPQRVYEVQYGH